jgi:hypothetical protein
MYCLEASEALSCLMCKESKIDMLTIRNRLPPQSPVYRLMNSQHLFQPESTVILLSSFYFLLLSSLFISALSLLFFFQNLCHAAVDR